MGSTPPELPVNTECSRWLIMQSNGTCQSVASWCNITVDILIEHNPFLENGPKCENLLVGSQICCSSPTTPWNPVPISLAISNICGHNKLQSLCAGGGRRKSAAPLQAR